MTISSGEERAYHIVNQVAWDLRADGAGTFYKPSGANYKERSIDVIIYKPGGETYDILGDAEGIAKPQWTRTKPTGFGDVSKWRAAVPPLVVDPEPVPEPEPEPEPEPPPTGDYITRAGIRGVSAAGRPGIPWTPDGDPRADREARDAGARARAEPAHRLCPRGGPERAADRDLEQFLPAARTRDSAPRSSRKPRPMRWTMPARPTGGERPEPSR